MKSCAICARLWRPPKIDMSAIGIFDSVRIEADVTACELCGSTSRVGRGLCLNCLLLRCLGSESENESTLRRLLDEIEVRDADWRIGNYQILEEIGRGGKTAYEMPK